METKDFGISKFLTETKAKGRNDKIGVMYVCVIPDGRNRLVPERVSVSFGLNQNFVKFNYDLAQARNMGHHVSAANIHKSCILLQKIS